MNLTTRITRAPHLVQVLSRAADEKVPDAITLARRAGITPDPWQQQVLRSSAKQLLLLCSRQSGKSTVTALLALHTALYTPGAPILLLSPTERQSVELLRKVREAYDALANPCPLVFESVLRMEFANGSRVIALPGAEKNIRGYSGAKLLVIDEAARVSDDLVYSVRPMLAVSAGRLVMLSTPWGKRGEFFRAYTEGGLGYERVKVTAEQCPRIPPAFLAEERRSMPDMYFRSEYLCEFTDTLDSVFRYEDIQAALDDSVAPLFS